MFKACWIQGKEGGREERRGEGEGDESVNIQSVLDLSGSQNEKKWVSKLKTCRSALRL